MMKRLCGILLSLALVLTLLPTAALAADAATTHQHPICGGSCSHEDSHGNVTWEEVSDLNSIQAGTDGVTNYYCLSRDVELTSTWIAKNNVVLCLNGHTINGAGIPDENDDPDGGKAVIVVKNGVSFTLTDCKGGNSEYGKITHHHYRRR